MDGQQPAILMVPSPDDALVYAPLPVSGDDGFPHAFLADILGVVYRLTFSVSYTDPDYIVGLDNAGAVYDLPDPVRGLYLELRVEREDMPDPVRLMGVRRVVLGIPIAIRLLRFRFTRVRVAQENLVRPGSFGSELVVEVAVANA
jgi:hypothetical protein